MNRSLTLREQKEFQVILLGNTTVGKTSLLLRSIKQRAPTILESVATVGAEFYMKTISVPSGIIRLKVWDSSGQERFREVLRSYYLACSGAIVVYDIQSRKSFEEAQDWVVELRERLPQNLVIVLVGNKVDMESAREVPKSEAQAYARGYDLIFMETSTVSGENVNNCFSEMAFALNKTKLCTKIQKSIKEEAKGKRGKQKCGCFRCCQKCH